MAPWDTGTQSLTQGVFSRMDLDDEVADAGEWCAVPSLVSAFVERVRGRVAAMFASPYDRVSAGSPAWFGQLALDIQQATRNAGDREEVLVRRERVLARCRGVDRVVLEELALARIEWACGLHDRATVRLARVLPTQPFPTPAIGPAGTLLASMADAAVEDGRTDDAAALYRDALRLTTTHRASHVRMLAALAQLHLDACELEPTRALVREGLERLGWASTTEDPYRAHARKLGELDEIERSALVVLVTQAAICDGFDLALGSARQRLAELCSVLGAGLDVEHELLVVGAEGWLDLREGRYADAERRLGHAWDELSAAHRDRFVGCASVLVDLGQSYLELGLVDAASSVAKQVLRLDGIGLPSQRSNHGRARCLAAECALRRGEGKLARRIADVVLADARDPIVRSVARRVLAAAALQEGDRIAAAEHARRSIDAVEDVLGEDLLLVEPLLVLAAVSDDREAVLRRAVALPMPPDHPARARVLEALNAAPRSVP
jgi:tetratricopeptide (TPR) repeat protein